MTHSQFAEWCEFYALEPWGFEVDDFRHGMHCATIAAAAGAKDVDPRTFMMGAAIEEEEDGSDPAVVEKFLLGRAE